MPAEPIAAIIYVFLLMPGLTYLFQSERRRAAPRRSPFRETSIVIVASAIFLGIPLILWAVFSYIFPQLRSELVDALVNFTDGFRDQPVEYLLGTVAYLVVASSLAYLAASDFVQNMINSFSGTPSIRTNHSGWSIAFDAMGKEAILVASLQLKSGAWIQGFVASYSPTVEESDQRSIVLSGSILVRSSAKGEVTRIEDGHQIVVQASEIEYMTVSYLDPNSLMKE